MQVSVLILQVYRSSFFMVTCYLFSEQVFLGSQYDLVHLCQQLIRSSILFIAESVRRKIVCMGYKCMMVSAQFAHGDCYSN